MTKFRRNKYKESHYEFLQLHNIQRRWSLKLVAKTDNRDVFREKTIFSYFQIGSRIRNSRNSQVTKVTFRIPSKFLSKIELYGIFDSSDQIIFRFVTPKTGCRFFQHDRDNDNNFHHDLPRHCHYWLSDQEYRIRTILFLFNSNRFVKESCNCYGSNKRSEVVLYLSRR